MKKYHISIHEKYFTDLQKVSEYNDWKNEIKKSWDEIQITEEGNVNDVTIDAGKDVEVRCNIKLPNISVENIEVQVYYGTIKDDGTIEKLGVIPMKLDEKETKKRDDGSYTFVSSIELNTGGNYGYTFRVLPKHEMLLDSTNLNLIKWITTK
jgi:starch phosphorylase